MALVRTLKKILFLYFFLSIRLGRDKDKGGRKILGSLEVTACTGFEGPEEQRSLTSNDSLGSVSNVLLIPRLPSAQYEVSSSLGYMSTRGETFRTAPGIDQLCLALVFTDYIFVLFWQRCWRRWSHRGTRVLQEDSQWGVLSHPCISVLEATPPREHSLILSSHQGCP